MPPPRLDDSAVSSPPKQTVLEEKLGCTSSGPASSPVGPCTSPAGKTAQRKQGLLYGESVCIKPLVTIPSAVRPLHPDEALD